MWRTLNKLSRTLYLRLRFWKTHCPATLWLHRPLKSIRPMLKDSNAPWCNCVPACRSLSARPNNLFLRWNFSKQVWDQGRIKDFEKLWLSQVVQTDFTSSTISPKIHESFGQFLCAAGKNFEKKTGKKGVFRHFLENIDQKIAFFGASSHLKFSTYLGNLGPVSQKWISQNSTKGDPLGWQGVEPLRGASAPSPYSKSAPAWDQPCGKTSYRRWLFCIFIEKKS